MEKQRKMAMVARVVSFAEAEEIDIAYHAGLDWKASATTVEEMRKGIWSEEYEEKPNRSFIGISKLNDDRDDFIQLRNMADAEKLEKILAKRNK